MSQVKEIKDAVDIVTIIGERIDLKRSGSSYKGLCPFHGEKSPSFFVSDQMQRYKCFGCGVSGDVLEFLQQYEGMSFLEALKYLADRAGIELKKIHKSSDDDLREKLLEILNWSLKYYHYLLTEHKSGEKARQYLKERGTTQDSVKLFKLGYALPAWDGLFNYLTKKKKYKPDEILQTGLIIKSKTGRYYDRFRDRIMFPLKNHRGQVVGFSGRALNKDEKTPKYINTSETKLYHKSKMLFGYSELFQQIRKKKELLVCEGEFDVISSSQAHVKHICAIKGSALTEEQARLIHRVANKVILSLDADQAGVKATKRAIKVIKDVDLELRVLDLSRVEADFAIKDADDIASNDPKLWREVVKTSVSVYDFLIRVALDKFDPDTPEGKRKIVDDLAPVLHQIAHKVEQEYYVKKLAEKLGVRDSILADDIRAFGETKNNFQPKSVAKPKKIKPNLEMEQYILFLFFHLELEERQEKLNLLSKYDWATVGVKQVLEVLEKDPQLSLEQLAKKLPEDLKASLFEWYHQPEFIKLIEEVNVAKEWQQAWKKFQTEKTRKKIKQINQEIENLETKTERSAEEEQELEDKLAQIVKLQSKLRLS